MSFFFCPCRLIQRRQMLYCGQLCRVQYCRLRNLSHCISPLPYTFIAASFGDHHKRTRKKSKGDDSVLSEVSSHSHNLKPKKLPSESRRRIRDASGTLGDDQRKKGHVNVRSNQFAINKQLMTAKSWRDVLQIVEKNLEEFNTVNIATAYLKLGKSVRYRRDLQDAMKANEAATLNAMTRKLMQLMGEIEPRELCNAILGLVYLRDKQRFLILDKAISTRVVASINSFDPQGVANTLWAYTTFEIQPADELESRCLRHVFMNMDKYKPLETANVLWTLAASKRHPGDAFLSKIEHHALATLPYFGNQELSNSIWAFATLEYQPSQTFLRQAEARILQIKDKFTTQGIVNPFWAFAQLQWYPGKAYVIFVNQYAEKLLDDFIPQEVSNLMWAFAKLNIDPSDALESRVFSYITQNLEQFSSQGLSNILWSCVTLSLDFPLSVLDRIEAHITTILDEKLHAQALTLFLWSFATLRRCPGDDLLEKCNANVVTIFESYLTKAPGVMQTLSNFCWAYASLGISPPAHLLTKLLGFMRCLSFDCPVQEVSSILWACSVFLAIGMDIEKDDLRFLCKMATMYFDDAVLDAEWAPSLNQLFRFLLVAELRGYQTQEWVPVSLMNLAFQCAQAMTDYLNPSQSQEVIFNTLKELGYSPTFEHLILNGSMSVDIALLPCSSSTSSTDGEPFPPSDQANTASSLSGSQHEDATHPSQSQADPPLVNPSITASSQSEPRLPARPVAIEVDGPRHFRSNEPTCELGHTVLRNYILRNTGWVVISVNLQIAWERIAAPDKRKEYLEELLQEYLETPQPQARNQNKEEVEAVIDIIKPKG